MEFVSKQSGLLGAEFSLRDRKLGQIQVCQQRGWLAKGHGGENSFLGSKSPICIANCFVLFAGEDVVFLPLCTIN